MGLTKAPIAIPSHCSSCPVIVRFFFYFNYSPACVWKFFTGEIIVFPWMIASLITCMFNFNLGFFVILRGFMKVQSSGGPQKCLKIQCLKGAVSRQSSSLYLTLPITRP